MKRRKTLGALLALLVLAAPMMAAGPAFASETVQFDGDAADSTDQTNTTYIATNSDVGNVTIQMTEDQSVSTSGSIEYNISFVNVSSAEINSSSGSGTLEVSVDNAKDKLYVNETGGTSSATLESLNVTYNVSDSGGIDVSYDNWMENESTLIEDPDASETQTYLVYARDKVVDVEAEVVGAELEFNESSGELEANGSDATGQFVFHLTRNNSTYEDIPLSVVQFDVGFNTTYFSDVSEETNLSTDTVVLTDIYTEDGEKHYTLEVQQPDNVTSEYWDDVTVRINATAESGEVNETLSRATTQNPDGGVQTESTTRYDHAAPAGIVSPNFTEIGDLPTWAFVLGMAILVAAIVGFWYYRQQGMAMRGFGVSDEWTEPDNLIVMVVGLGTLIALADALLGSPLGVAAGLAGMGIPAVGVVVIGAVVLGGILYLNANRSAPRR